MSNLVPRVDWPEGESGPWRIKRFVVSEEAVRLHNLRDCFHAGGRRQIDPGTYTRLTKHGAVIMSDTPAECRDHIAPVIVAQGRVLVGGLGLGVVVNAMLHKPAVEHVQVIEIDPDVIALVGPHLLRKWGEERIRIIQGDLLTWRPLPGERWAVIWCDIWPTMCADNVPDMQRLNRRFKRRAWWMGHWGEQEAKYGRFGYYR